MKKIDQIAAALGVSQAEVKEFRRRVLGEKLLDEMLATVDEYTDDEGIVDWYGHSAHYGADISSTVEIAFAEEL